MLIPITGHTLPLISHGGTAYIVLCGAFGMILSVNRHLDRQEAEERAALEAAQAALAAQNETTNDNHEPIQIEATDEN